MQSNAGVQKEICSEQSIRAWQLQVMKQDVLPTGAPESGILREPWARTLDMPQRPPSMAGEVGEKQERMNVISVMLLISKNELESSGH